MNGLDVVEPGINVKGQPDNTTVTKLLLRTEIRNAHEMQEFDTFLGEGTERFLSVVQFTQIPPRALSDKHGCH